MGPHREKHLTPLRVAHLIATNFLGGPEKQILEHARRLNPARFSFTLVSFVERGNLNELLQAAKNGGIRCRELRTGNPFNPSAIRHLVKMLREEKTDLLVTHGYKSNVVGRIATRIAGIPMIALSRGWTGENRKIRLYEALDKRFLHLADHVVAVSGGQREKILALGVPELRVSVIHNAIDLRDGANLPGGALRKEFGIPEGATVVVSAGRLSPEKNFECLIRAASRVIREMPEVFFLVFGEGFLRPELERAVCEAGIEGRFRFPGFRKDFPAMIQDADLFVLPSFTEGLPNVVLEAFAQERAVVATSVGGTPEVVEHGRSGILLQDPSDQEAMAAAILDLLRDAELRRRMGAAGKDDVKRMFNLESQTASYEKLYADVLGL
ncbi:MAG: glycosyltransferase [Syntrophales bacterium]